MSEVEHLIGLLLGTEEDWPRAFETLLARLGPVTDAAGTTHRLRSNRVTIEPFNLRDRPRHALVIDRLAYWYYHPREWLKKVALMDGVYLLNSPFTFQSMEKHAAYCAMIRLGLQCPGDRAGAVQAPGRQRPVRVHRGALQPAVRPGRGRASARLSAVHEAVRRRRLGRRLAHPRQRRAARGLRRVGRAADAPAAVGRGLRRVRPLAVDRAGDDGHEVPARPADARSLRGRARLPLRADRRRGASISRVVNSFFRWEFNSCEMLVRDDSVYPIDYANACPDVAITSLHYYFPWAMAALLRWSVYCVVTGRPLRVDTDTARYFEIADRTDLSYEDKLAGYRRLSDEHFDTDRYAEFCSTQLESRRRPGPRLGRLGRLRRAAGRHRPGHVPARRARPVRRPFPRTDRRLARRPRQRRQDPMGRHVQLQTFSRADRTRYRDKVRANLDVLARMLAEATFEAEHAHDRPGDRVQPGRPGR